MTRHDFTELYACYPEMINQMPDTFTSHQFILELARHHQRLYVQALYAYRDDNTPFMTVHSILAKHIYNHADLIAEDVPSADIFGQRSSCAQWRRRPHQ